MDKTYIITRKHQGHKLFWCDSGWTEVLQAAKKVKTKQLKQLRDQMKQDGLTIKIETAS